MEAAVEIVRGEGDVKEPFLRWFGANFGRLAVYLLVAAFVSAVAFVLGDYTREHERTLGAVLSWTAIIFFLGGLYALPGALVWLFVVSRLAPGPPARSRRRLAAWLAPPTIGLGWIILGLTFGQVLFALIYGVLLPAGSAWVIRFREMSTKPLVDVGF